MSIFLFFTFLHLILIISILLLLSISSTHVYASVIDHTSDKYHLNHLQLHVADTFPIPGDAVGPESFAFDPLGQGPYTGVSDGRILKWDHTHKRWIDFATVSSSPRSVLSTLYLVFCDNLPFYLLVAFWVLPFWKVLFGVCNSAYIFNYSFT